MQKVLKMFLRHSTQNGCSRLLKRSFTICQTKLLPPPPRFIVGSSSRSPIAACHAVRMNSSVLSEHHQTEQEPAPPTSSSQPPAPSHHQPELRTVGEQRDFYIENPDKLLTSTMTPELEAAVLAAVPNGEFGLKKLLAELDHLQTKKPYPLPLPEYLTVGKLIGSIFISKK